MKIPTNLTTGKRIAAFAAVVLLAILFLGGLSATARAEKRSLPIMGSDANMTSPSFNLDWDVVGSGGRYDVKQLVFDQEHIWAACAWNHDQREL